jgi:hypothetical protein
MFIFTTSNANGFGAIAEPQGGKKFLCEKTDDIILCRQQRGTRQS